MKKKKTFQLSGTFLFVKFLINPPASNGGFQSLKNIDLSFYLRIARPLFIRYQPATSTHSVSDCCLLHLKKKKLIHFSCSLQKTICRTVLGIPHKCAIFLALVRKQSVMNFPDFLFCLRLPAKCLPIIF